MKIDAIRAAALLARGHILFVWLVVMGLGAAFAQQPPLIQWLVATPSSIAGGGSTTLRWHVDGADSLTIDQGIGAVQAKGSTVVSPSATTTYTLTASNTNGSVSKSHVVVVAANPNVSGGRFVHMVSPLGGQKFTAPATLRVFAAAFNPTGQNCGAGGFADRCADRVDFYVGDTLMAQVPASQSEYWIFKTSFGGVGAGTHRVWARAIYTNPTATLDSEPMWITVEAPPTYAQTIDLTQDVVLSGSQAYELVGTAAGRIRLNGNGHRVTSSSGWTGRLTLKYVDVFGMGPSNVPTPAIAVGTSDSVQIEDSTFDSTGTVSLSLTGSATASLRRNEFRSNMTMPQSQQPEFGPDASYPAIEISGGSTAQKFFQGNTIGVGWADFRNADNWLIGGAEGEGNVVIGPRGGIWAQNMERTVVRGNLSYHVYYGGWSQGNNMEIGGSDDIVIEHNVIGGGSWPIRSLGGTLRYNLVLDAGHQWLWITASDAIVHHNVFVGGDAEVAGIWAIGTPQNVEIYNNTVDGLNVAGVRPVRIDPSASASLHSNAIVNMRDPSAVRVDGVLDADYNLFSGQQGTPRNYSDNRFPPNDAGVQNEQVNPQFLEAPEPWRYGWDDLWTRRIAVSQVLANYRTRYTPAPGSPLIDTGEPTFIAGNDIGAVGSGQQAADDLFGFTSAAPPLDTTPPTGTIQINGGAASTSETAVTLSLTASDNASGVVQMRLSDDGITFGTPVSFAGTASWTLPGGVGTRTVHVQFRDGAGNWSGTFTDSIELTAAPVDTTPPTGTIQINGGAATTDQVAVTLSLTATDNATGVAQMRFSNDGTTFGTPIAFAATAPWTLTSAEGPKTVHVQFRDGAGNWSAAFTDGIELVAVAPPPPGLVAAYGFNEGQGLNAADASGNGLAGTVSSATWATGKFGSALQFTGGSNSTVTVASSPLLQFTSAFTLSAWVNPATSQPSEPTIIAKEISGGLPYVLYAQGSGSGPNAYTRINGNYQQAAAAGSIPANTWTHLAATYNGTTLTVYVNGVLASSAGVNGILDSGNGALKIGNNSVFSNEGFVGLIDEVRVYNRALSAAEIQTDMATAVGTPTPPVDTTPPTGTIQINGGAATTDQAAITLSLTAADDASGVAEMRFSNDGTTFNAPVAFSSTASWTLTSGNGPKTVHAQFRDGAGNWSSAFTDGIVLEVPAPTDTTPPTGTIAVNGGAASTAQTAVTLSLTASDNATGVAQMRFSNDGATFGAPMAFAATAPWTLTSGNGMKTVHAQFRDGAGNWSAAFTDSIELSAGAPGIPQLGAHVLLAQNELAGTHPAVTPGITTQPNGSTLLALSMGWLSNLSAPVDSRGNTWSSVSGPNGYFNENFYTAMWAVPSASGGSGHTLSFAKQAYPVGEISMALIEVINGGQVDLIYSLAPESNQTPGSITVDGPATLIAIWGGDSGQLDHTAVPDNGFTVIESYLDFGNNGETAVQVAIAAKQVTAPGTYTVKWTSTPMQKCACYLIAVRNSQQPTPPTGLVAAYGFDEGQGASAGDVSGNNLTGAVSNAAWTSGRFGGALQFTGGINSLVTVASSPLLNLTTGFTLSAWVNPMGAQQSEPTVIAKEISGNLPYVLYAQGSTSGPNAYVFAGGTYQQAAAANGIPANTWTHLTTTYDGTTLSMYVNGVLSGSAVVNGSLAFGNGPLQIANNSVFPSEGFIGLIDEVRVYNRALPAAEIQAVMETPVGGSPPVDTTPPTGTIQIDGGAASTDQAAVTLSLTATDDAGGVAEMRFSNDGTTFSAPVAFATTAPWNLAVGDGPRTVHVQFRDGAGNWSTAFSDSIVANTGLVAAYGFNEGQGSGAADVSGNGLAGTVANATWATGRFGNALQFTGASTSAVTVASSPLLQLTTAFTLSAWVNPGASQPPEPTVIAKEISGGLPYVLYSHGSGGGPNAYALIGANYQQAATANTIAPNTWTHLAATYNGTTLSIYVNGVLTGSSAVSGNMAPGNGALKIGNNSVFSNEGFVGLIDEVRVYSRALSPAQIQADMALPLGGGAGSPPPPPPPVDTTPPAGTIVIDGGAVSTEQAAVTLSLTATDNATGVAQMRFSNDGITFSTQVTFASTAGWTLSGGDGAKTVHVQFRDGAGNWSNAFTDGITLATPPLPPIATGHPRILLVGAELQRMQSDLATQRPSMKRFKEQVVDAQIGGANIYGYEPWYSALIGVVTGNALYCAHAIQMTDAFLDAENVRIQNGQPPESGRDHYLFIGHTVGGLALVYDWCYSQLTATQRLRWGNYADRFTDNVWNQNTHHWGEATAANGYSWEGTPKPPGSSWSVNNPINNYYYSFLRATMLWGLASKHEADRPMADAFLQKFRNEKVRNQLVPLFTAQLTGGGSREGTGYGTAMGELFGVYHLWEKTTGERIADLTPHAGDTMPYLLHVIAPTRDFLAPIGDHSRESTAAFYDYHRKEMSALASLYSGTSMARSVRDFLAVSSVPQMGDRFNWIYDVLYDVTETTAPATVNTSYYASGTGHFFTRSSWNTNATWLTFLTGALTESHAHADGLSLLLYKNGWLVGDANTQSHSGLTFEQTSHALVTQRRANGTLIGMNCWPCENTNPAPSPVEGPHSTANLRALAVKPEYVYASADQGTLFTPSNQTDPGVRSAREVVHLQPDVVIVFDRVEYTQGATTKTFQLPVAGLPTVAGRTATYSNGAATLTLHAVSPVDSTVSITDMETVDPVDFNGAWRIDSSVTTSGVSRFLHVLSVDNAVTTSVRGANDGAVTVTLADGRIVTLAFNLDAQGGSIEIRNAANQVIVSEALPTTVTPPSVLQ